MLSYKYFKDPKTNEINIPHPIQVINNIFKDEFRKDWVKTFDNLAHPLNTYDNKYNIWDILCENAAEILDNTLMSQYDKLYMAKLLCCFRDKINIAQGVEYYCLREIIRLTPFTFKTNIKWIAKTMATRIKELSAQSKTKKQFILFTKNYRKIEIIKRIYKTPIICRTHWKLVYDCWTIGESVYQELLNKTEILKHLNICQNTNNINTNIVPDKKDTIELEKIDDALDEEILMEPLVLVGLNDTEPDLSIIPGEEILDDTNNQYEQPDFQPEAQIQVDNIEHLSGSDLDENIRDEVDDLAVEPDEW
jgi:hypothetical protein